MKNNEYILEILFNEDNWSILWFWYKFYNKWKKVLIFENLSFWKKNNWEFNKVLKLWLENLWMNRIGSSNSYYDIEHFSEKFSEWSIKSLLKEQYNNSIKFL